MRSVYIHTYGAADVLQVNEAPLPEPGPHEVRVKIEAIGVNYVDIYYRAGQYPSQLPLIPGMEAAGVVDAVGTRITTLTPGTRVAYAMHLGSYAEYAVVPAWKLVPIPDTICTELAAASILQGMTAHFLSYSTYPLQANDYVLVHAAAGGVGRLLTQMLKRRHVRIIGTVSTDLKAVLAKQAGADDVILYTEADFESEVSHLTDGQGVAVVYDSVGKNTFDKSLRCVKPRGWLVLYGQSSGAVPTFDPQILRTRGSLHLTRPSLTHYIADQAELLQRANYLFTWLAAGEVQVQINDILPLEKAADAHRLLESRRAAGKILLKP